MDVSMNRNQSAWNNSDLTPFIKVKEKLSIKDDIILQGTHIVLPRSLQNNVIELVHKDHLSIVKTKQFLCTKV